ncbi:MAG: division/cell wall cluster transcriptional repressor MraZ [Phycisphaerales bacterium]
MLFTGQYEHSIDAKGRLAVPADIRQRWDTTRDGAAWIAVPWIGGLIRLYTETSFVSRAEGLGGSLLPDEDEAELQATFFGLAVRIEPDSAGRIRVPDDMREMAGLESEVVLVGAGDRLEVRDRAAWQQSKADRLAKLPELMKRISAKKRAEA